MRQVPTVKQDYLYFEELKTRWRDSDVYGHMNNAVFYEYADTIVNSWLINKGSLNVPSSKTVGLVVETRCTYFSELKFPNLVTAGLKLNKLGYSHQHYAWQGTEFDSGRKIRHGVRTPSKHKFEILGKWINQAKFPDLFAHVKVFPPNSLALG